MYRTCLTTLTLVGVTSLPALSAAQTNPPDASAPGAAEAPAGSQTAAPEAAEGKAPADAPTAPDAPEAAPPAGASLDEEEEPSATEPPPGATEDIQPETPPPSNDSFSVSGAVAPAFAAEQSEDKPPTASGTAGAGPVEAKAPPASGGNDEVFAEDWWSHARPAIEIHGAFRTRAELFHNFALGRVEPPSQAIWPRPSDNRYTALNGNAYGPQLCTGDETDATSSESDSPKNLYNCDNKTQNGANLRLRLEPEIHISDNLRIRSQIDLLDNLAFGSTPEGYRYGVNDADGVEVQQRSGYNQLGVYDTTQVPPDSSRNGFSDSVRVKRAWGEYTTPIGELRFGRMPDHWGLGMLYNAGNGYDDDYQTTFDRFMVTTGVRDLDLLVSASWDFPNEGAQTSIPIPGAQPYDRASIDDVNQYSLRVVRKQSLESQRLAKGGLVLNGGVYFVYRTQTLANDQPLPEDLGGVTPNANADALADAFARRDAEVYVPDLWLELKYKKFRFSAEWAAVLGSIASASIAPNTEDTFRSTDPLKLAQFGLATELEQKLVEDRLRLKFGFAWASGDPDTFDSTVPGELIPGPGQTQINDDTISTFRFHPAYRVDLILNRNILQRVQGTYLFRPSVEYDFIRDPNGQRAGGAVQAIWTRASEFVQAPGHDADLGIELNGTLYFQAKDGVLNDTPDAMGGFYSAIQYGVLFPLDGMGYQAGEERDIPGDQSPETAQTLRLFLGVMF